MTEVEQPPQNGIDLNVVDDADDSNKARPADIEQDMREMERRKRVEAIMGSKLFREELERIVDSARDSGFTGILQQLSDIVGVPATRVGSVYKASNCMLPINDIRGVESMGYAKGEKILRCKLAATFRLLDLYGWTQGLGAQITARLKVDQEVFLVNPYGLLYHEITASSLNKVDMQGQIVEQGTTNFGVNKNHFVLHSVVHAARPDIRCAIYIGCSPVVAVSSLKSGLLPLTKDACVLGEITTHAYTGSLDAEERDKLVRSLGPNSKVMLLTNHGALCCGETIEEAFYAACHIVQACETQLKLLPVGVDNLVLIPEESRKVIYEQSRRPPEDLEKKFAAVAAIGDVNATESAETNSKENNAAVKVGAAPKWRVGGAEFEALMRMLDNAGYRTGYIYRHPLIKSDPPRPKNDVELPPAVSSLGYLLEEEELFRQGIWKKGDIRKGGDRTRWLNSPNVYQKVEVLETGTPDPKKITKWVAEGSPTHSTPVRIEDPLQFVPAGTNPKEFKRLQQQIKDNRRADKISAGPQSQILEGVTWDEANRIKDGTVSSAGDHVVLMGAASKGIIQRGFQHNAAVYKAPYAKNPFDNVTDDELNEYKRTVERKKKSIHGEYTDTDFSESEALSSLQTSGAQITKQTTTTTTVAVSQSEPEDASEHQVMRIETQQAPVPSQPEVVLSDALNTHNTLELRITSVSCPTQQWHAPQVVISRGMLKMAIQYALYARKYAFLFEEPFERPLSDYQPHHSHQQSQRQDQHQLFMIHKIEIFPHYTYPVTEIEANNNHNNSNQQAVHMRSAEINATPPSSSPPSSSAISAATTTTNSPYRTVSHYGFNYPLTYLPTVALHPGHLLSAVELQRQKVINFIKSTALNFAAHSEKNVTSISIPTPTPTPPPSPIKSNLQGNATSAHLKRSSLTSDQNNGSFISVKEIQLEPKLLNHQRRRRTKPSTTSTYTCSNNTSHSNDDEPELEEHHELSAAEYSSLLSICDVSSAAGSAHNDDDEQERQQQRQQQRQTCSDKLYRSYVLHDFVPAVPSNRLQSQSQSCDDNELQHKPESEQAIDADLRQKPPPQQPQSQQHITLAVNATKRRSFRGKAAQTRKDQQQQQQHAHDKIQNYNNNIVTTEHCYSATASNTASDATTAMSSIELHISVAIRNADCVKSLQAHEQTFKLKLEKIIDDELHLLSQQLAQQAVSFTSFPSLTVKPAVAVTSNNTKIEHTSTPSSSAAATATSSDKNKEQASRHITPAAIPQPIPTSQRSNSNSNALVYQHTLALLEHELENLLNCIIRANELHNRTILCDCKTKISQITHDIRTSLNFTKSQTLRQ